MRYWRGVFPILLPAIVGLSGCSNGPEGPETVRVAGTVYLNGEPLEGAEIRFFKDDFAAFAVSGPGGAYELVQGAVPGENVVTITKFEGDFELDPEEGYDLFQLQSEVESGMGVEGESANVVGKLPGQIIPPDYSDPDKSKLTYTVPEDGTTSADLRLTSQ